MAFNITQKTRDAADRIVKEPNIVLCIDGLEGCFGSTKILSLIRIGDPDLYIGDDWVIGGFREVAGSMSNINLDATTNSVRQQLDIDKGRGSSISSMEIGLNDEGGYMSQVISPGVILEDILGRKAKVYLGFTDSDDEGLNKLATSFPEDYIIIFRGIIDDVKSEQGVIKLNVSHPDQKKRQLIYPKADTTLNGAINNSQTTITVADTSRFLLRVNGPDGLPDATFSSYIRIDDEIIQYTGLTPTTFTGCTRGRFQTSPASHSDEATVDSFYRLEANVIDLALKIMLSGWQDYFLEDVEITNFNILGDLSILSNTIFFTGVNVEAEYGITVGDYITTTGATNGANNVTMKTIGEITVDDFGSYIVVNDVSFVDEGATSALIKFRSQYDSLPQGLKMSPDEVDVKEHLRLKQLFLSSFDYDFYLKDSIEKADEWLEQQVYKPAGAYSLPRKARCSMGYFVGPLPNASTVKIDESNITNPDKLRLRRSTNKNFFNTILYRYEVDPLETKFLRGVYTESATSLARIESGVKIFVVEAEGMRTALSGLNNAEIASNRRLDRFKFGAEFSENVEITFQYGFNIEIGDILILDGSQLNLLDSSTGLRGKPAKFFEVINKGLSIKTGKVQLDLLDTGFEGFNRYALIGPSSRVKVGISSTQFVIEKAFYSPYGSAEYKKWDRFSDAAVKIRSSDFTTRFAQTTIQTIAGNTITVADPLGFTPQPGDIMELADYDFAGVTDEIKLLYVHMIGAFLTFPSDGQDSYKML